MKSEKANKYAVSGDSCAIPVLMKHVTLKLQIQEKGSVIPESFSLRKPRIY